MKNFSHVIIIVFFVLVGEAFILGYLNRLNKKPPSILRVLSPQKPQIIYNCVQYGNKPQDLYNCAEMNNSIPVLDEKRSAKIQLTVYHPTVKECGNDKGMTASGLKIDCKHPQRWIAIGEPYFTLLKLHWVYINSELCPLANGWWLVADTSGRKSNVAEILIPNYDQVLFGLSLPAKLYY